jgi:hypothetical protein
MKDRPVNEEIPAVIPPIRPVTKTSNTGLSCFRTSIDILRARIWSFDKLMKNAINPQNKNIAMKDDSIERINFCGIDKPAIKPAMAIDHQGNNSPIEKASNAVITIDTRNFI